jgi:predicted nucleic acid-binding Zn ribbon protein
VAKPERADSILDRLTTKMGIAPRLEKEKAVVLWEEAVGQNIARRAKAVSIKGGTLFVKVVNSAWLQELSLLKEGIIEKVNSVVGKNVVKDIMFRIGDPGKENGHGE